MARPPKAATAIDNNKHHKQRKVLDKRTQVETAIKTDTRDLVCPVHLSADAKRMWQRIINIDNVRPTPIIYDSDIPFIEMACEFWAVWAECQRQFFRKPFVVAELHGEPIVNPVLAEMRKIEKELTILFGQLGMTPKGRAQMGVDIAKAQQEDEYDFY